VYEKHEKKQMTMGKEYMNSGTDFLELNLMPKFGFCNDVRVENYPTRKIVWLVPHVIKRNGCGELITWRCNWGKVCNSMCLYAMAKEQTKGIIADSSEIGHRIPSKSAAHLML
jgi:hypothetical protein